ncbi:N-terminal C2 in EEIG1 and EHBP1 proteins-domain-containing protein [Daldinia loculata]|uniref:N-terminal C2 in EEIG1 and EHBP1 proteins-domain-containing protein n=1 Tax=Daldinia loculata TaxID=103429 RepID=UPI0020C56BD1|nr:N-terminal C2 in EEIG1 and EHBP1 proteins-domain-containing protein [Daldinia loculata]KAI1648816.1 N-terminal C2 in EEIG1 and EHBP1 proteins-domain-containing protein [Daldinia loculata]
MRILPIVNKARKPKFELHLTIYDLNNVPLVAGTSTIKWYLPNSIHGENRGRTAKCSIDKINHRVVYNYSKIIPLRISIDRNNNLSECPIEFEVLQEFPMVPGGRDEKIPLGVVKLNLSEYVEESENFPRRSIGARASASLDHAREKIGQGMSHRRQSSSKSGSSLPPGVIGGTSPPSTTAPPLPHPEENDVVDDEAEEGIVRRYLMQESKINSTLKIGILMIQIDGERNYVAPPLKTAPMFGGIAGIMTGSEQVPVEAPEDGSTPPSTKTNSGSLGKSRDASELQDMYRRALAASWACQPGELPADECIEDIFSGGDGWSDTTRPGSKPPTRRSRLSHSSSASNNSGNISDDEGVGGNTLRPADIHRMRQHHLRTRSGGSDRSSPTLTGGLRSSSTNGRQEGGSGRHPRYRGPGKPLKEDGGVDGASDGVRSRSGSLTSLAPTLISDRGREGFRRPKEVDEYEEREDLVAWTLPETVV